MDNFWISPSCWIEMNAVNAFSEITSQLSLFVKDFEILGRDISAIKKHITSPKSLWEMLSNHPLAGVILGAGLTLIPQWWMGRKKKVGKIKAALASFENTRFTLLSFKGNYVMPYRNEMSTIFRCIENAAIKLNLPTPNKANEFHLSNNQVIEMIREDWKKLSYPFRFSQNLVFYKESWAESLSFIANHAPEYLISFHKSYEYLQKVNQSIQDKNMITSESRKTPMDILSSRKLGDNVHENNDISYGLEELVNTSLAFNQCCIDHLNEYAKNYFGTRSLFNFKLKTNYDGLMPIVEDCLPTYLKQMQDSINARKKARKNKLFLNLFKDYFTKKK